MTIQIPIAIFLVLAFSAFALSSRGYRRLCAVVLVACGLTACTVGPWYKRPNIPPPEAWRASDTPGAPTTEQTSTIPATAAWPSSEWWKGFKSAQLDDLMAQAQQANDDLAAAVARVREADAQVRIAGAPLFPSIGVNGDATRQRAKVTPAGGTVAVPKTYNTFSAQVAASYELDFWGKNLSARRSAGYLADASRYDRATVELTVMSSVAVTYFQAMEAHDRLVVAEQDLSTAQTVLNDLKTELRVGVVNALDVAEQETTVAVLNASIPPLRQQFRQSVNALAVLVGKPGEALEFPGGILTELSEPQVQPGLTSELLARRPDVAASEAQLMSANADIAVARAAFFPNIDLTADGGFVSTALATLITPVNRVFAISGGLTQSIFSGGQLTGTYNLRKARYAELLADYHKSVISAFTDVENALVALQQTADQYQRQTEAVNTARHAYEITETQMHAGVVNVLTVLNTQSALFSAQDALVQVRFAHLQALVQLYSALGGGWQRT